MLGDCFHSGRIQAAVDDGLDLDPILLVSGMGGSILNARNKKNGFQLRAWVRILLANLEFKKYLWSLYNPKTGLGFFFSFLFLNLMKEEFFSFFLRFDEFDFGSI